MARPTVIAPVVQPAPHVRQLNVAQPFPLVRQQHTFFHCTGCAWKYVLCNAGRARKESTQERALALALASPLLKALVHVDCPPDLERNVRCCRPVAKLSASKGERCENGIV